MGLEVNLGEEVTNLAEGFQSGRVDNHYLALNSLVADDIAKWNRLKIERNTLTAMLGIWTFMRSWRSREARGRYGLISSQIYDTQGNSRPIIHQGSLFPDSVFASQPDLSVAIVEASSLIGRTVIFDLRREVEDIKKLDPKDLKSQTYKRLTFMTARSWRHGKHHYSKTDSAVEFIRGGAVTGYESLSALVLTAVDRFELLHHRLPKREELANLVDGTYPGLAFLASFNVDQSEQLFRFIYEGGPDSMLNPDLFELIQQGNKFRIIMKRKSVLDLKEFLQINPANSPTTGCTALVPISTILTKEESEALPFGNVIQGFGKWLADIVRDRAQ